MKGQAYATALFYNESLFQQRGLAVPNENWTLDDLVKAAQALTQREGTETVQWGYALGGFAAGFLIPNLRGFGGDVYSPDGKKAVLDSPGTLEALQWHENLFTRERIAHPIANTPADFYAGKIAMVGRQLFGFGGSVVASVGDKFKWSSVIMPKHPKSGKRGGQFSGDMQAVAKQSKVPDGAFELLKFITGKEYGVALGLQTSGSTTLGGRFDVYEDPRIVNNPAMPRSAQLAQVNSVKQIREPFSRPWNFRISEVEQVRDPALAKILDGTAKADSAYLREVSTQIQVILDKPRQT
jgi:ABC-type glycerol-3-phosphate transport system substrate-binding protein